MGVLANEAVINGETMGVWFPILSNWAWSLILLRLFVLVNRFSLHAFGKVEFWLASIKVLAILVITAVIPWNELPAPTDVTNAPITLVFEQFGLPGASMIMQLVIFTAVISVLNSGLYSGLYSASRMFSSLTEQGYAPKNIAKKSKRGIPVAALLASTVGGVIATIVSFAAPDSGVFSFIMNSAGLVALFVYIFIAVTQMRMRLKMTPEEVSNLKLKIWLSPWLNIVLIVAIIAIVGVMLTSETGRTQVFTSLIAASAVTAYWPLVRKNLKKRKAAEAANGAAFETLA